MARAAWRAAWFGQLPARALDSFVFVDEFGATTQMQRTHGHWKVLSTVAAMATRGIVCSATFDGATDADTFVAFVGDALVPALRPGQVVVMDNLAPHKHPRVRELIEGAGCELLYLPPYSPDYNPIEQAISKVKGVLRSDACRDVGLLYEKIGDALRTVTRADAEAFMRHSGYTLR